MEKLSIFAVVALGYAGFAGVLLATLVWGGRAFPQRPLRAAVGSVLVLAAWIIASIAFAAAEFFTDPCLEGCLLRRTSGTVLAAQVAIALVYAAIAFFATRWLCASSDHSSRQAERVIGVIALLLAVPAAFLQLAPIWEEERQMRAALGMDDDEDFAERESLERDAPELILDASPRIIVVPGTSAIEASAVSSGAADNGEPTSTGAPVEKPRE